MPTVQQTYFATGVVRNDLLSPQQFYRDVAPLELARGDSAKVRVKVYKTDGTVQDLTGLTIRAAARPRVPAGAAVALTLTGTVVGLATAGDFDLIFTAAATTALARGDYLWDAVLLDDQVPANVTRLFLLSPLKIVDGVAS